MFVCVCHVRAQGVHNPARKQTAQAATFAAVLCEGPFATSDRMFSNVDFVGLQ